MKAYSGTDAKEAEVPAALQSQSSSFREKLIEAIAEFDDKLIEKYLEWKELSQEEVGGGTAPGDSGWQDGAYPDRLGVEEHRHRYADGCHTRLPAFG
jgi:hypothetical protein